MIDTREVLVAVDGSDLSVDALRFGKHLAERIGAGITAVTAWDPHNHLAFVIPPDLTDEAAQLALSEELSKLLAEVGLGDVASEIVAGRPSPALHEAASKSPGRVLVMGTRGLGTIPGLLLGSVSRRLLFDCACPLILVPAKSDQLPNLDVVVVALDGSAISSEVARWSAGLCSRLNARAVVTRAVDPGMELPPSHVDSYLVEIAAELDERWCAPFTDAAVPYQTEAQTGDPRAVIPQTVTAHGAGMAVVAGRGSGQFQGLGGTTSYLVRHLTVPLAVLPSNQ